MNINYLRLGYWLLLIPLLLLSTRSVAQLTINGGAEWVTGEYGRPRSTDEFRMPFGLRYAKDRWTFRAILPYHQVEGFANAIQREITGTGGRTDPNAPPGTGGGTGAGAEDDDDFDDDNNPATTIAPVGSIAPLAGTTITSGTGARQQSGIGDLVLTAFYGLIDPKQYWAGVDVGVRAKIPIAGASQCLITNGAFDFSFEANVYKPIGRFEPSLIVGWTKRGDADRRDLDCRISGNAFDLKDPFYFGPGIGFDVTPKLLIDLRYLYRQRLLADSDPFREARVSLRYRLTENWQVGGYGLLGFSKASPDWGLGATVGYRF